jgi:CRP-like cAMP-binding protein
MIASARVRFAALRATRELANCSDKAIQSLLGSVDEIRLPAGAAVAQAGRYCTELVVVMEGMLRAVANGTARRLGPGDSVGWAAMWDRSFNEATVFAESEVRLLVIGHSQFRAFKAVADRLPIDLWSRHSPEWEQAAS